MSGITINRLCARFIAASGTPAKLIQFAIFLFCTSCLSAQIINGKIENALEDDPIYFSYSSGLVQKVDSAHVAPNGRFTKKFGFKDSKYVLIIYGALKRRIYVFPEAKIELAFNATSQTSFINTFTVQGDHNINSYLDSISKNNIHSQFIYDRVNTSQPIDSFSFVLGSFMAFSDSLRRSFFPDVKRNNEVKPLKKFLTIDSINWYSYSLLAANDYVRIIRKGDKNLFREKEIRNKLVWNASSTYLLSDYYRGLWLFFLKGEFEAKLQGVDSVHMKEIGFTKFAVEYISRKQVRGKLRELIASQLLTDILEFYTYRTLEQNKFYDSLITTLKQEITDNAFVEQFEQQHRDKKKILVTHLKGKKAPDFTLVDTTGNSHTLKDFEGKVILIDVWASWCQPCIKEMPYLKQIEDKLKGNGEFQILSVSIDDSKQAWIKNGVLRFKPPGIGLWAQKKNGFITDYNVDAIPVLILLDRNGNFVDFNPPRPSDGDELFKLISKILQMPKS